MKAKEEILYYNRRMKWTVRRNIIKVTIKECARGRNEEEGRKDIRRNGSETMVRVEETENI